MGDGKKLVYTGKKATYRAWKLNTPDLADELIEAYSATDLVSKKELRKPKVLANYGIEIKLSTHQQSTR